MDRKMIVSTLKKNAMLVVLVLVYLFFMILTGGGIFKPTSFAALINQNAYVYILGCGMLMCMLTGGNIDLSCGAFVCLLGALGGVFMIVRGMGWLRPGRAGCLRPRSAVDCDAGRISGIPRPGHRNSACQLHYRFHRAFPGRLPEHFLGKGFQDA